jgi:carbamoyltransferase
MIIKDKHTVVELLLQQKVGAIFQGSSEIGPRALGNRSIIFDPRNPNGKEIVNIVKKREWYRPFAGTIMLEYVHDYFEMLTLKESPWMSFAVKAKPKAHKEIPSIIHVDGTCRIQTVTKEQNKNFYELIEEFYKKTGVPVLFNTSFNLAGAPLVETIEDALDTINNSDISFLYLPED